MYQNSPEYLKKIQKWFKYTICETEPKLGISVVENYAYGYHLSLALVERCNFGSNLFHVKYKNGQHDDSLFGFLYVPATVYCLVTCFKLLILTTQRNFIKRGPSFLDYMWLWSICRSQIILKPIKQGKKLPTTCSESMLTATLTATPTSEILLQSPMWLWYGFASKCLASIPLLFVDHGYFTECSRELCLWEFKLFAKTLVS